GRNQLNGAGVGELIDLSIRSGNTDISKADSLGERGDRCLRTGKEMPAIPGIEPTISFYVKRFLRRGLRRSIRGIEADHNDVKVFSRIELQHIQSADQAVHLLGAKHVAAVVDQRQNRGTLAEIFSQMNGAAGLIAKLRI